MVNLRIPSLKGWLWRKDAARQEQEVGKDSDNKGEKSGRLVTSGKSFQSSQKSTKDLQRAASGTSSSSSSEFSLQQASDWSIGWYEPHGPGFGSDDSYAVLVACYDSPSPSQTSPQTFSSLSNSQLWADVLTKVAMEYEAQAESSRKPPQ